ncbi:hypothetical protein EST38_g259 [Candolleomyces aberdarensis]|uniref:Pseudouridine synthase RsuA/RluA-like domain-containing protein n=1 Tax=Candolleomyces aberdarensis TaxID=2316362 RepID=A0A4Q2DYG1_9AGAR|nr:hypothetical protein EST38_g259 [Candolleomyces aberdarensis]
MTVPSPTNLLSQINRSTKAHIPLLNLPAYDQFKHNLVNLIKSTLMTPQHPDDWKAKEVPAPPGLKKIAPYWYPYTTMTKMRWIGRELLEVVSTEFRDRSMEYYRYALESGVTTVNGQVASPTTKLRDGDRIENVVHRHEPPVTSTPVKVLYHDVEREFILVDKPGSIPVHASGRYFKNTLIEILVTDFGFKKVYPANRLDRLTSGLMIIPLSPQRARLLTEEFTAGTVKKEYVARVKGKFPEGEIVCEQPMLTVDRQMGLNIVHPEGKPAKTVFNLIRYDDNTETSVVKCEPHTGRSHQLRVHLQYLGYPIANDPVYSDKRIWDEDEDWSRWRDVVFRVKGALNPHSLIVTPPPLQNRRKRGGKATFVNNSSKNTNAGSNSKNTENSDASANGEVTPPTAPRDCGGEDSATPSSSVIGGIGDGSETGTLTSTSDPIATPLAGAEVPPVITNSNAEITTKPDLPPQYTEQEIISKINSMEPTPDINSLVQSDDLYCPECYLPLHPDPKPEKLYIFLHARKYTTSLGAFETEMPEWAAEGWTWDQN